MNEEYYYSENFYQQDGGNGQNGNDVAVNYGLAVTSLVLGIVSVVFFFFGINILTAIVSITLAIIFLVSNSGRGVKKGRSLAIWGIITSILSLVMFVISWVFIFSNINNMVNMFDDYMDSPGLYYEYNFDGDEGDIQDYDDILKQYEDLLNENQNVPEEDQTL